MHKACPGMAVYTWDRLLRCRFSRAWLVRRKRLLNVKDINDLCEIRHYCDGQNGSTRYADGRLLPLIMLADAHCPEIWATCAFVWAIPAVGEHLNLGRRSTIWNVTACANR